jgi:Carboxypeptidase regulatory-like domain
MRVPVSTAIALFLGVLRSVAQDGTASLTGKVQVTEDAIAPGTAAVLESERAPNNRFRTVADAAGVYRFAGLPAGDYNLTLYEPAFQLLTVKFIHITDGEQKSIPALKLALSLCGSHAVRDHIRLLPAGDNTGNLGGTVRLDPIPWVQKSPPIADADVILVCSTGRVCGATRTDSKGEFRFEDLPPGEVSIQVNRAGFYPLREPDYTIEPGLEQIYAPIYIERCHLGNCDPKLRPKKPLQVCE